MQNFEIVGVIAGVCSITSLVPQIIKSWKTKSTKDISLAWTFINASGQALWTVYGIFIHSPSLIATSIITTITSLSVLLLKVKNG
jgi:MtN3 and saliva related transmembrane protein